MPVSSRPQVVTANALRSGHVVWLTATGQWSDSLHAAQVFTDPDVAETVLALAQARTSEVVGAYLARVDPTPDGPAPVHFREAFRRDGPSPAARIPARG